MHRLKMVLLACMAVCMLGVVAVASASAESALPLFTTPTSGTATSGEGKLLVEGKTVTCTSDADTFGAGTRLGAFTIDIKNCTSKAKECHGLGQSAGLIELTGEYHLVSGLRNRKSYYIWFLLAAEDGVNAVHIECASPVGTLLLLWGNILGSIAAVPSTSTRTFKININTVDEGLNQEITEFGNNNGAGVAASLKGKLDGGVERPVTVEWKEFLLFMSAPTTISET
jgi:hypothetical protein